MEKSYKLKPDQIERLVPDIGFAFATDMITVEGKNVDYMVRQQPDREDDSGWIFYGGGETQEYMDNSNNTSLLSINTVANYDPEIIGFLTYPPGTEIERNKDGRLQVVTSTVNEPEVVFLPPVDRGPIKISKNWSFNISGHMLKRLDKGSLVIWRPEFTIWLGSYDANGAGIEERISNVIKTASPDKTDFLEIQEDGVHKIKYHLQEVTDGKEQNAVYIFALTDNQEIHMAIYYDNPNDLLEIEEIWKTLKYTGI
ncbi:DUF2185 domain-containing protein [Microbulbifer sp. TRSA001]|uniref:DUF2185 domain-containing protein n=1 Tax=unclassified Microbulbifer TaxID=2619833 RepID=UPI0024ACD6F2|nr:DUF2185 domain-containing protein [Microbulbifer sp. VAAF005]WHI48429.1 DUF2185 domain-containing protein [Microbulbifer sp. VAAF005]